MTRTVSFFNKLEDVARFFQLGKIVEVTESEAGLRSVNYFITNHKNDQYVIRCSEELIERRFNNIKTIQLALKPTDLRTNFMLTSSLGTLVYKDEAGKFYATVSEKIEGYHPKRPVIKEDCFKIGQLLAQFHTYLLPTLEINSYDLFVGKAMVKRELQKLSHSDDLATVVSLLEDSAGALEASLPSGILHGDLHTNNVLLQKDGAALLDLECSGFGPYILDIGRAVADICSSEEMINRKEVDAFIAGYETMRKLTKEELEHLNEAIGWGAACIALWGFVHNVKDLGNEFIAIGRSTLPSK